MFKDIYPDYKEIPDDDYPTTYYYKVEIIVGGRDEDGEFLLVLEGPAQGERVYL